MKLIDKFQIGNTFVTHYFGECVLRKVAAHSKEKQVVAELKQLHGSEVLQVTFEYLNRLPRV